MQGLLKSEIFFFVSTIALVVISTLAIIALFYAIKILKNLKIISEKAKERSSKISESVELLNDEMLDKGLRFFRLLSSFFSFLQNLIPERGERKKIIRHIKVNKKI